VVMETLGHSQVSLTLNTYSQVLPALQREAIGGFHGDTTGVSARSAYKIAENRLNFALRSTAV